MNSLSWAPVYFYGSDRPAPIVLFCEHASFDFPADFGDLGLDPTGRASHVAGDIGALSLAKDLSDRMDAPLVHGGVSRLLYDCNRPDIAPDAVPEKSEAFDVPGNRNLSAHERQARHRLIHQVFHKAAGALLESQCAKCGVTPVVVTIHSFTPVYLGQVRDVEIGYLFDTNSRLSELAMDVERRCGTYNAQLNQPYSAADGVTYSLSMHTRTPESPSTMIEVRNDLIDTSVKAEAMAAHLAHVLSEAIGALNMPTGAEQ